MYNTCLRPFCFHCRFFPCTHYNAKCKGGLHLIFCSIQLVFILHFAYVCLTIKPLLGTFVCSAAPILKIHQSKTITTHLLQKDCHLHYDKLQRRCYWTEFKHTWLVVMACLSWSLLFGPVSHFLLPDGKNRTTAIFLPQAFLLSWNFTAFNFLKFVVINS